MRKVVSILLLLALSTSVHAVMLADFETGLDGWNAGWDGTGTLATSTAAGTVTSGSQSLALTAADGYWQVGADVPLSALGGVTNLSSISFDLTQLAAEWPADKWTMVGDQVIVQSDGPSGQVTLTGEVVVTNRSDGSVTGKDWGNWGGTASDNAKTYTLNLGNYDLTGATWFQIIISVQGGNGAANFYFDNVRAEALMPVSTWRRFEVEDAVLSGAHDVGSGEGSDPAWEGFSGSGYVRLQNPAGNLGVIAMNVNVREAGDYPCRYAVVSPGDEHWDNWAVNVDLSTVDTGSAAGYLCRENYAASYTWAVDADAPGNFTQAQLDTFVGAIELGPYASGPEPWQIISLWGPHWDENSITRNDPMTIPLEAGQNTLYIQAGWGWATYDYVELEVGYVPLNPYPVDGGYAIIPQDTALSWDNALFDLDTVEVWFGETPEPNESDPNSYITAENYKDKLTLIYTESNPGPSSAAPMPALQEGVSYTWVVDGYSAGDVPGAPDPNDTLYGGPFWTFYATNNVPPTADAGDDQYLWLNGSADVQTVLDGSASTDDGLDAPLTYAWTQTAGPAAVIDAPDSDITALTLSGGMGNTTEAGAGDPYQFQLEISDGLWTRTDTVTLYVNSTSCTASIEAGGTYAAADIAGPAGAGVPDCRVNLLDLAEMASGWLTCANTFEPCTQ